MESQQRHPHELHGEHDHGHGGQEHHHEKTGIMKKVKAKAKKIKDSIKKHSHMHGHEGVHEHDRVHIPDDHDLDEEDTEEEDEIVQDPAVHGVTLYESVIVKGTVPMQMAPTGLPRTDLGGLTAIKEDPLGPKHETAMGHGPNPVPMPEKHLEMNLGAGTAMRDDPLALRERTDVSSGNYPYPSFGTSKNGLDTPKSAPASFSQGVHEGRAAEPSKTFVEGQEQVPGHQKVNLDRPHGLVEDPAAPKGSPSEHIASNYESKVTDPTAQGGKEIGASPILHSLDEMNVYDEQKQKQTVSHGTQYPSSVLTSARHHDQSTPELGAPRQHGTAGINRSDPVSADASKFGDRYPYDTVPGWKHSDLSSRTSILQELQADEASELDEQPSYTDNISSATSAIADKTASAKDYLASKLGYGGQEGKEQRQVGHKLGTARMDEKPTFQGSNTEPASSATSAIAAKAASAKDFVASKLGYGEEVDNMDGKDSGMSMGEYERERPTSYTQKISSAAAAVPAAVASSAISAKNVVATQLGYGGDEGKENMERASVGSSEGFDTTRLPKHEHDADHPRDQNTGTWNMSSAAAGIPAKITEVATSAKDSVASKLGYHQELDDKHSPVAHTTKNPQEDSAMKNEANQGSSYGEKISSAAAAVPAVLSDTVVSAKDKLAYNLGYGHEGEDECRPGPVSTTTNHPQQTGDATERPTNQGSSYTQKISSSAAALPASIAEAAISTKDAVASKFGYGDKDGKHRAYKAEELGPVIGLLPKHGAEAQDFNEGTSMKSYLEEKSRPGTEDRALSQLISETLHLDKGEEVGQHNREFQKPFRSVTEIESTTIKHDTDEGRRQESHQPRQKVTLEEVTERLEPDYDEYGEKVQSSYVNAAEGGVVNKIKGAVASLIGIEESSPRTREESESSSSHGQNEGQNTGYHRNMVGERWLQESGN